MTAANDARTTGGVPRRSSAWRTLGYMFHILWINQMFFSSALYANYSREVLPVVAEEIFRTSIVGLAVSLTLCAVFHRGFMALAERPMLDYCGPVLATMGLAAITPFLGCGALVPPVTLYASAALTGLGSALTLINVGRRFVGVGTTGCIVTVLWATVGSSLFTYIAGSLPFVGCLAAVLVSPFLSIASLHRLANQEAPCDLAASPLEPSPELPRQAARWRNVLEPREPSGNAVPAISGIALGEKVSRRLLLKLVVCASVLGIVTGALGGLSPTAVDSRFDGRFLLTFCAASFVASSVILAVLLRRGHGTMESLYRPATFLITVGFALVPLFGANTSVPYAFVSAGYSLFEMLVWVILCEVASRFQFTSVQVFGYGRALVVGSIVCVMVVDPLMGVRHNAWVLPAVSAMSIIAVSLLRTYILTSTDVATLGRTLWERGPANDAPEMPDPINGAALQDLPRKVPFLKRCALIGEYYGLTRREIDVFRLLAAGRNSARIQEELMISAGTVNTHSYHVFQKMGVHCQQEVIDLFEGADLDAIAKELGERKEHTPSAP